MMTPAKPRKAPLPLLILFGVFLISIGYLVAASLTRGNAPVFPISVRGRERAGNWQVAGDTLTIDGTDGDRWQYVSLQRGRVLDLPDTAGWEIAVQRYRVITPPRGGIADLGTVEFGNARAAEKLAFVSTSYVSLPANAAIEHWYRYNLLTHLLEPNGHVFAVRSGDAVWKLAVVSYYCPKLVAGCLTIRYAPMTLSLAANRGSLVRH